MSDHESKPMSQEALGDFFLPIIDAYTKRVEVALTQSKNKDLSNSEWKIISENGQMGKFVKPHTIANSWDQFDLFFQRKGKLYGFIEEKQSGLVDIDFVIWVFFSPETATQFFNHLVDRPKHFNTKAIVNLPFIKLLEPLIEKAEQIHCNDSINALEQISKTLNILEMGDKYLNDGDITILDTHVKKGIVKQILLETNQLLKDINSKGSTSIIMEKRLDSLFQMGWRYFRARNELETRYFKKLLSEDPQEREKGLKLTLKKVIDFKKEASE